MSHAYKAIDKQIPSVIFECDSRTENLQKMQKFYEEEGWLMLRLLDEKTCGDNILEQWREVIMKQEWEKKIQVSDKNGNILDINNPEHRDAFLEAVTGPLNATTRKHFSELWPLHRGFGATCDDTVFHLPGVWQIRQNKFLYKVASKLMGQEDLLVDVNRSIQKLPDNGTEEMWHFDFNIFHECEEKLQENAICGKVMYTKSRMILMPKTHKLDWVKNFKKQYSEIYSHVKASDTKVGLKVELEDPLNLLDHKYAIDIEAGCIFIWNRKMLHGQEKTKKDAATEYGSYIGYMCSSRLNDKKYENICGVSYREDRLNSYVNGVALRLWPSYDKIQFTPKKFDNFPKIMQEYVNKLPANHEMITSRLGKKDKIPHVFVCLKRPKRVGYKAQPLTNLGQKLLGIRLWSTKNTRESRKIDYNKFPSLRQARKLANVTPPNK